MYIICRQAPYYLLTCLLLLYCIYCLRFEYKTRVSSVSQGNDHICSSALSPCGSWLAYSTLSGVRLYRLQYNNVGITKVGMTTLQLLHRLAYRISSHSKASGSLFNTIWCSNFTSRASPFLSPGAQITEGAALSPPPLLLLRLIQTLCLFQSFFGCRYLSWPVGV